MWPRLTQILDNITVLFKHPIETFRVVVGSFESNGARHFQAALYSIKAIEKPVFLLNGQPIRSQLVGINPVIERGRHGAVQSLLREIEKRIYTKMNKDAKMNKDTI